MSHYTNKTIDSLINKSSLVSESTLYFHWPAFDAEEEKQADACWLKRIFGTHLPFPVHTQLALSCFIAHHSQCAKRLHNCAYFLGVQIDCISTARPTSANKTRPKSETSKSREPYHLSRDSRKIVKFRKAEVRWPKRKKRLINYDNFFHPY